MGRGLCEKGWGSKNSDWFVNAVNHVGDIRAKHVSVTHKQERMAAGGGGRKRRINSHGVCACVWGGGGRKRVTHMGVESVQLHQTILQE